ncbi:ribosome recycling factor [Candidatus Shapirobacteria bacterium CG09_land_8_20_14_0_10_49_15]|uniref:Ribosome-recycling factor n=2 Tax=Candidatus Shapironibacteriota TaxID=1752721 RepID=A0A2M8L7X7_9BACT|nr:MAG: ribosome recycling factor [Candidatus Shapirobacteria bacterium CG09_land_8_20_14_0_10_49_15]PJE70339.1 MAG: ribosome recycling factor [Candidatus Shapirobacteria bacterium CG10_big_fil_rev_8_21_14_0_10_48_15]
MKETRQKMSHVLELLAAELATLKAGKATPALVERIMVDAYQTKMPVVELATITTPEPSQLLVAPFDQSVIRNIEKALALDRGLGLQPVIDGEVIRIKIPPLTEEKRKELVKLLQRQLESARIMIRQVRSEKMTQLKHAFENQEIFEDDRRGQERELQKLTDEMNEKIEEIGQRKEQELLRI